MEQLRRTGIDIIDDVPWGTHFCNFYNSRQDLLDILVPYFKAGLEDNEFCMWITAEPLGVDDAVKAMRKAMPDFDSRLARGQIEILPYDEWYLQGGSFDAERVLDGWLDKLDAARVHGYAGLRLTGNTFWLEKKDWDSFLAYEQQVNDVIGKYRMLAICTYSLKKCDASEVIDVVNTHQFALAKRDGKWDRLERAESRLAEERVRSLARFPDENPNAILRVTSGGKLLYANDPAMAMLKSMGWTKGSLVPKALRGAAGNAEGRTKNQEFEVVLPSNRIYSFMRTPIPDEGYANLYGRDITERKEAEEALQRSKEEWERTFDTVPDLLAILDTQHRIVRINNAMAKRLRLPPEACVGRKCYEVVHGAVEAPAFCPHVLACRDGKEHITELHEPRIGGYFLESATPMFDEHGKLTGIIHVARDITERKQAEEQLRRAQEDLNHAQQVAHVGSWRLDVTTNELTWSDENHRIFGVPKAGPMTYETFLSCVHPDDRRYVDQKWNAGLSGEPYDIEHRIVVGEQVKWVREKAYLEFNADGKLLGGFGITQDITERKLAEEERQRLLEQLESKNKELQSIVYVASHDLRSPLVNVSGFTGQLSEDWETLVKMINEAPDIGEVRENARNILEKDIPDYLNFIKAGAQKMQMVINGLLTISRLGNAELHIAPLDMNRLISQVVTSMTFEIQNHGAEVPVDDLPPCAGDPTQINQLFSNLLNNAVKYLDPNRTGLIRVTGKVEGSMSVYSISDNGVGIAENHKEKIFEIFHRLNPNDGIAGDGLGLSIVMRILDRHNGRIWLDSKPGKGSTFHVALPTP